MAPSFNKITQIKKGMTQIFQRHNYTRGVTLTELLVVVIIAVLGALALPMLNKAIEKDRVKEAITNLNFIRMAQKSYFLANNTYTNIIANLNIEDPNSAADRYFEYTITAADAT